MFIRTVFLYLVLIAVIRLLGKRQLGQMEASEVVVTMVVADLAAIPMQDEKVPLTAGLIPIGAVLLLELLLSFLSIRNVRLRKWLCGKPVILMENGKFLQQNMRKTRITLDELISQLRQKEILDPSVVQFAILETNGNLSVFPYPEQQPVTAAQTGAATDDQSLPVIVINDGVLLEENLKHSGRERRWLERTLKQHDADIRSTFLLTVNREGQVQFYPKDK